MPKTRRDRSVPYESFRKSPVPSASSHDRHKTLKFPENKEDLKEWEETKSSSDAAGQEMILGSAQSFSPFEVGPTDAIVGSQERRNTDHSATSIFSGMHKLQHKLVCPLCRGQISGWIVQESARLFMNDMSRSCARETCEFNGNYADLRKHAREDHPLVRPSQVDPEMQRNWRRLERQRDIGDVLSTIRSSFGDDVIDGDV